MKVIEVTAQFLTDGTIHISRFSWNGRDYQVESQGRQWQAENGRHVLVTVVGGRMFELLFMPVDGRWFMARSQPHRMAV